MTIEYTVPPPRQLPLDLLSERKQHLLAEVAQKPTGRLSLPTFPLCRLHIVWIAATGACAAAAAVALVLAVDGSGPTARSPFLIQAVRSPAWGSYRADWGGGRQVTCARFVQVVFGCKGILMARGPVETETQPVPAPSSGATVTTAIEGGSLAQRDLLHSVVEGMRPSAITSIEILASGRSATLRMKAPKASTETLWQESLVAVAFRDRVKAAGTDVSVYLENDESNGALIPPGPASALPSAKPGDAQAARQRFQDAAGKIGVSLDELTSYEPDGVAVSAILRSSDPASFLVHRMPAFLAAIGDRWHDYDGVFIRLVDRSGTTVWETSTVARTSSGSVGSRQDLAGCSPVANWGPSPPPCPQG
jgi:hypothetical protein